MTAPLWNGRAFVEDLKAMKEHEAKRDILAQKEAMRRKAFANNINSWHKNTGRRIH